MAVRRLAVVSKKETMMTTNLQRRGSAYYVRVRIPNDLLRLYGVKKEIKYSLRTNVFAEARRCLATEIDKIHKGVDELRIGTIEINSLPQRQLRDVPDFELTQIANLVGANYLSVDSSLRSRLEMAEEITEYKREKTEFRDFLKESLEKKNWAVNEPAAASTLTLLNIQFDKRELKFQTFNRILLAVELKATEAIVARINGAAAESKPIFKQTDIYRPKLNHLIETLTDIAKIVVDSSPDLASKTKDEKLTIARDFDRFYRNKPFREITRGDCQIFVNFLNDNEELKASTIVKKIGFLKGLFDYALAEEWIPFNPTAKLKLPARNKKKSRVPYDIDDLRIIFSSPIYSTERFRPKGGRGEAAAWIPLIALFTGARLEEIAQLCPADVYKDSFDDVWVLRITNLGERQNLKTASSNRLIPIHDALIEAGLLRFVDAQRKKNHARVFHELTRDKHGAASASWSKWYGRYVRELGITDPRKVFHSYRHLFKHIMRRAGVADEYSKALMGHSNNDVAADYGADDFPLPPLVEALKKLRFPDLVIPTIA